MNKAFAVLWLVAVTMSAAGAKELRPAVRDASFHYDVEIRRTSFGIPHIKAANEASLGYGIGWAYAQDNLCLLAGQIVTANGERSKYFGAEAKFRNRAANLQSDTLYRWLDREGRTASAWKAQPVAVRRLLQGYADGVNRYLADTPVAQRQAACAQAAWVHPITALDLMRLSRFYTISLGAGGFAEVFGLARPGADPSASQAIPPRFHNEDDLRMGSNAVAIGGELSANGRGMLLGNPHLEWDGPYRFWQLHATIPGTLDVMGASLPGYPGVQIGFNRHVAWSHTVDTSAHYVLYRLQLDPADPTRYVVDGKVRSMKRVEVWVDVLKSDGRNGRESQIVYETDFGPVVGVAGWLPWTREAAYALHDPNLGNDRTLAQWLEMGKANSLRQFRHAIETRQGIPWVNTLAADDTGQALYLDFSVVPFIDAQQAAACAPVRVESDGPAFMLDGSRTACRPRIDSRAAQPGIFPTQLQPVLARRDFVQNSNDSAWLTNPAQPLVGYSPFVSRQDGMLRGRTRLALDRLTGYVRDGVRMDLPRLKSMVTDNEVYFTRLVLDDLKTLCAGLRETLNAGGTPIDVDRVCAALAAWNGTADIDAGQGYLYFSAFMDAIREVGCAWATPFDARDPIHTPRGLNLADVDTAASLRNALVQAIKAVQSRGLAPDTRWGDIQVAVLGRENIPMHGGDEVLGIYNHIGSSPMEGGLLRVTDGATYLQAITFERDGPRAEGFLVYSESMNPDSPHEADQARRFSRKQWITFPFTESQIVSDPDYSTSRLTQ